MLARALLVAALATVSASAQDARPLGVSVGHGLAAPEALAFPATRGDYAIAFDDDRLVDVAVFWSTSSYSGDQVTGTSGAELPFARFRSGIDRRAGLAVGFTFDTPVGDLRVGASGAYVYDRDRTVDYVVVDPSDDPNHPPGHGPGLVLDLSTTQEAVDRRLYAASGVSLSRTVQLSSTGSVEPAVGVALGTYHRDSGRTLIAPRRAVAYLRIPVQISLSDRIGLSLESALGYARESASERRRLLTGRTSAVYVPETQVSVRATF